MSRIDPIREAEAARVLRESLAQVADGDDALVLDSIEGETGLFEAFDALLARMAETRGLIVGVEAVEAELGERKRRFAARLDTDRALLEQALMVAELPKVERPLATLSLATRQPRVEIGTESDIPAEFWKAADPKLDKKAVGEALKAGRDVPGAYLTNAAPSLTIRNR